MSEDTHARQLLVFTVGAEHDALPIKQVHEIIRDKPPRRSPPPSIGSAACGAPAGGSRTCTTSSRGWA